MPCFTSAASPASAARGNEFYEINTLGTRHVVEGCLAHGVGRLVYTSSPSVTFDGHQPGGRRRVGAYPRRWLCHYPTRRRWPSSTCLAANGQGGLLTCALRPHLIWGPRDRHLIPRLFDRARRGRLRRVGDGTNLIDTVYVENAAAAHLLAADALTPGSPVAGRAYFISQGEPVNCWQWIDELLALAGLPPVRKSISLPAAWAIGAACEAAYWLLAAARRAADDPVPGGADWRRRTISTSPWRRLISAMIRRYRRPKACAAWPLRDGNAIN